MSDLISRQDAIEYFMTNTNWHDEEGYPIEDAEDKRALLTDYFNGIPSAQQWIPCSERPPEDGERVIVQYGDGSLGVIERVRLKIWNLINSPYAKVVAWMPAPEPYKEEGAE